MVNVLNDLSVQKDPSFTEKLDELIVWLRLYKKSYGTTVTNDTLEKLVY